MTFTVKRKAPNPNGNPNFKPKWKTGNTIAIRIPEAIADLVVSVARKIDSGELSKADVSQLCLDNNAIALQLTALDIGKPSLEIVPPIEPTHEGGRVSTRGITETIEEFKERADHYRQKYDDSRALSIFHGEQLRKAEKYEDVRQALANGLQLIEQFEQAQRASWGQSANQRGPFKNDSPRWAKYQEFKAWVFDLIG